MAVFHIGSMRSWARSAGAPIVIASVASLGAGVPVWAIDLPTDLPFDISNFSNQELLLDSSITNPVVSFVGLATDHKPYEPATALGNSIGLDLGVEVTLAKVPDSLGEALAAADPTGSGATSMELPPVLPVPRLHLHKGMGPFITLGLSLVFFQGMRIYGGDLKFTVFQPEEGPTVAIRAAYSETKLGFVFTRTLSPQILISRALNFADPYIGIGYAITQGAIEYETTQPITIEGVGSQDVTVTLKGDGRGASFFSFLGLRLKVPYIGLLLVLEGSYSAAGIHTLGTKIGFSF